MANSVGKRESRLRRALARLGLLALGVVLSLVVMEIVLQVGAAVIRTGQAGLRSDLATRDTRILMLGDSNTYGLHLDHRERDAYPFVVERLWNERADSKVEVVNLGFPGANSSRLRSDFRRYLDSFTPDVVTVMIGVNDFWTEPVPKKEVEATLGQKLWSWSRVYRFLFMAWRAFDKPDLEIEIGPADLNRGTGHLKAGDATFDLGWKRSYHQAWRDSLRDNLRYLADTARERGIDLVLFTYPADTPVYAHANAVIRRAAAEAEVPLVDLASVFAKSCPDWECGDFYPDRHPTAAGHRAAAEILLPRLLER